MRDAGLEVSRDVVGNLLGRRGDGRVWVGSHLDSVADGGRFDGVLGVVAAIEVAEQVSDAPMTVVAFRSEESGFGGSRGLVDLPDAFLELHIEQGPVLEQAGAPLGVVSSIVGLARGSVVFEGRADHAGTTPMDAREDALLAAARFALHVRGCARGGAVATVGALTVEPNLANVVPARATVSVDARAASRKELDSLIEAIGFEPDWRQDPVAMSGPLYDALCAELPDAPRLDSGAGHDAMVLAARGVPTAMLFVRSLNGGASHSNAEHTSAEDVACALDALAHVLGSRLAW
jgi:hydantoinase/carbamoylase family amidase